MMSLCCNDAVITGQKKFTINYKHWFTMLNFETTKIRSLDISSNNKILPKLWFPKILLNYCLMKKSIQKSINQLNNTTKCVIYEPNKQKLQQESKIASIMAKNLMVLKMTQFSTLMTTLCHHHCEDIWFI